jgi:hypothetical protein
VINRETLTFVDSDCIRNSYRELSACTVNSTDERWKFLMRTDYIVKLSKLQISELNTLVQKETSGDVEGNLLLRTSTLNLIALRTEDGNEDTTTL